MQRFLGAVGLNNPYVSKIGLGGSAQAYLGQFQVSPRVLVFADNAEDHIHLQTS